MARTAIPSGAATAGLAAFESENFGGPGEVIYGDKPLSTTTERIGQNTNLPAFSVVGRAGNQPDGDLVLANFVGGQIGDSGEAVASGALTYAANATAADTVTIGATVYTAVAAGTADAAGEYNLGATKEATAANLAAAINGEDAFNDPHPDVYATVSGAVVTVRANEPGTEGNAIGTTEAGTNTSWGGSTLSGGTDIAGGGIAPVGITTVQVVTGAGVTTTVDIYRSGHFNQDALNWDPSFNSDIKKQQAFEGSKASPGILISKPKYSSWDTYGA